jgi:hypothetical protein
MKTYLIIKLLHILSLIVILIFVEVLNLSLICKHKAHNDYRLDTQSINVLLC